MATTPSMGVASNLGMATSGATPTEQYEFLSESLAMTQELIRTDGLRGTRVHPKERVRVGRQMIGGDIVMQPAYGELRTLLPRIIAAEAGVGPYTYTITETSAVPVSYSVIINRGNVTGKEWVYANCRTARAVFRSGPGQPLEMTLSVEALTETQQTISTWSGVAISATAPFIFQDATFTYNSVAYPVVDWECTIDWALKTDRWVNSQTRTDLPSMDLMVHTKFTVPFNTSAVDTSALYNMAGSATGAGASGDINFSWNPGTTAVNLKFDFAGNLKFAANKTPVVSSKDEILMVLESEAYNSGAGNLLVVTLDPTN